MDGKSGLNEWSVGVHEGRRVQGLELALVTAELDDVWVGLLVLLRYVGRSLKKKT